MTTAFAFFSAALAANVTICVDYDTDFVDSDVTGATEDFMASNGLEAARGILVVAEGPTSSYSGYTGAATNAGCVTLSLPVGVLYTIKVQSKIQVATGYEASVRDGEAGAGYGSLFSYTRPAQVSGAPGTHQVTLPVADWWNAAAVASRALTRNTGGRPSLSLDLYVADGDLDPPTGCPANGSCLDGTDVWLHADDVELKFKTAYFLGWAVLQDMGYDRASLSKTADDTYCHVTDQALTFGNLEHTTTGFPEGYAFWYASTVFNESNEADCSFTFWDDSNWDQLDVCHEEMEAAPGHVLSCATGPSLPPYEPIVPDTNFRSYCLDERNPGLPSIGKPSDTVVPLDVVRFLHDRVYTDSGLKRSEIGDIFAAAVSDVGNPSAYRSTLYSAWQRAGAAGAGSQRWTSTASTSSPGHPCPHGAKLGGNGCDSAHDQDLRPVALARLA